MSRRLTPKQRAFITEYLFDFNATRAARRAGYGGDEASLAVIGFQNLRNPRIRQIIDGFLAEDSMPFEEILYRLSRQARGSLRDFMRFDNHTGRWVFDLGAAVENGSLDLVEKIILEDSSTPQGSLKRRVHLKLYNAQKALVHLGRAYGLFQGKMRLMRPGTEGPRYSPPLDESGDSQLPQPDFRQALVNTDLVEELIDPCVIPGHIDVQVEPQGIDPSEMEAEEGGFRFEDEDEEGWEQEDGGA